MDFTMTVMDIWLAVGSSFVPIVLILLVIWALIKIIKGMVRSAFK